MLPYLYISLGLIAVGLVLQVKGVEPLKEGEVEAKVKAGVGLDSCSKISCKESQTVRCSWQNIYQYTYTAIFPFKVHQLF